MKSLKTILSIVLILFAVHLQAQLDKDNTFLGTNYNLENFQDGHYWLNSANLQVGHFFWNKTALILDGNFKNLQNINIDANTYRINLTGRRYFKSRWEKLWFFSGLGTGFSKNTGTIDDFNPDTNNEFNILTLYLNIDVGVNYFITKNWSVGLSHRSFWSFSEEGNHFDGNLRMGFNFHF